LGQAEEEGEGGATEATSILLKVPLEYWNEIFIMLSIFGSQ